MSGVRVWVFGGEGGLYSYDYEDAYALCTPHEGELMTLDVYSADEELDEPALLARWTRVIGYEMDPPSDTGNEPEERPLRAGAAHAAPAGGNTAVTLRTTVGGCVIYRHPALAGAVARADETEETDEPDLMSPEFPCPMRYRASA